MSEEYKENIRKAYPSLYASMYPDLRQIAKDHGYAIAIHGSLARDMDLMAMPWTETASTPEVLAEAIRASLDGYISEDKNNPNPAIKPHGRLAWSIVLLGNAYIDLSVMPLGKLL